MQADEMDATASVYVPEWGAHVRIRGLTQQERGELAVDAIHARERGGAPRLVLPRIVSMGTVDATGRRLFSRADVPKLGEKNAKAIDRVASAILNLTPVVEGSMN